MTEWTAHLEDALKDAAYSRRAGLDVDEALEYLADGIESLAAAMKEALADIAERQP